MNQDGCSDYRRLVCFSASWKKERRRKRIPSSCKTFLRSCTGLFSLHPIVQNWSSLVTGSYSLYFVQLKIRSLCPKNKREQRLAEPAVSATGTFGAGQSERFLKITALISFPGWEWFLPQNEQVRTWNSKMENTGSGVMVECSGYPRHLHPCVSGVRLLTKVFFEHFLFWVASNTKHSYCQIIEQHMTDYFIWTNKWDITYESPWPSSWCLAGVESVLLLF